MVNLSPNNMTVSSFSGKHRFLSNFYPSRICYENRVYPTVEHAFQAAKTLDYSMRDKICEAKTPGEAKKMGRQVKLRHDWELVKIFVMYQCVREKFLGSDELSEKLLATGDSFLIEGNTWNDTFWGVCSGTGQNWLGRILMVVRETLRHEPWSRCSCCPR